MARIQAKYAGSCWRCGNRFPAGTTINWVRGGGSAHAVCPVEEPVEPDMAWRERTFGDAEVSAGAAAVREIQAVSAPGSAYREQLYMEMEMRDYNLGLDG